MVHLWHKKHKLQLYTGLDRLLVVFDVILSNLFEENLLRIDPRRTNQLVDVIMSNLFEVILLRLEPRRTH